MKTIGFDIDGTLTFWEGGSWLVKFIPTFFLNLLIFSFPRKKVIKELKKLKRNGNKIILISNRPKNLRTITLFWLWYWRVPYDEVVLVGQKNKKVTKANHITQKKIEVFYDNSQKIVKYLKTNLDVIVKLV
jgi:uncharacterized HAD superfamily protein